jgi:hypothetical protein
MRKLGTAQKERLKKKKGILIQTILGKIGRVVGICSKKP